MKKLFILLLLSIFVMNCVESINTNPGNDDDPPIDDAGGIAIYSPIAGDTIKAGTNIISYESYGDIGTFEIFINENPDTVITVDSPEQYVVLSLNIDASLIGTFISYKVNVYRGSEPYDILDSELIEDIFVSNLPAEPTNLVLTKLGDTQVNLVWQDNAFNETNYQIYRKDGENGIYRAIVALGANTISYNDFGLSPFIIYYYKVRAINSSGISGFSNEVNTLGTSGPGAPSNLIAEATGASTIRLTWTDNSPNTLVFKIQRIDGGNLNWVDIAILPSSPTEYIDAGLISGTTYRYRVAAIFGNSQSDWSNEASATTKTQDVNPPQNLIATFNSLTRNVDVVWLETDAFANGTSIERRLGTSGNYEIIGFSDKGNTTYYDNTYSPNNIYYYRARHLTTTGFYTNYSNSDSAYIPNLPVLPPNAPSDLELNVLIENQLFGLLWKDNSSDEEGFEIQRKVGASGTYESLILLGPNSIAYNDNVDLSGVIYYYKVRAFKGSSVSAFSNEVNSAGGSGTILRPTNLSGEVVEGELKVNLTWIDNSNNELFFELERRLSSTQTFKRIATIAPDVISYTDDNDVQRGNSYDYRIRAVNTDGFSEYSDIFTIQIPF